MLLTEKEIFELPIIHKAHINEPRLEDATKAQLKKVIEDLILPNIQPPMDPQGTYTIYVTGIQVQQLLKEIEDEG